MKSVTPSYIKHIESLFKINKEDEIIRNIISNVKKRNYQITDREYTQLERFKRGDVTPYSPKNEITLLREYIKKRILEAIPTDHYLERKEERGKGIFDVFIPSEAFKDLYRADKNNLKSQIISNIKKDLEFRLSDLEDETTKFEEPVNVIIIYKALYPKLKLSSGKIVDLQISTKFTDNKGELVDMFGNGFYALAVRSLESGEDIILTLLLANDIENDRLLTSTTYNSKHTRIRLQKLRKRGFKGNMEIKIVRPPSYTIVYDLDSILSQLNLGKSEKPVIVTKSSTPSVDSSTLPYEVKDSYPVGTIMKYKGKGTGEIIRTSSGPKGEGDSSGKLQWVEVDFPRGAIKLPNIFTTAYKF